MRSKRSKAWHRRKRVEAVIALILPPPVFLGVDLSPYVKDINLSADDVELLRAINRRIDVRLRQACA